MMHDPDRLGDDPAGHELARALREAQGDVLSPEAVDRVQAGLLAAGIGAAGAGGAAGAAGAAGAGGASKPLFLAKLFGAATPVKVGLAALGLVAVAGLSWEWRARGQEGASLPPDHAVAAASTAVSPPEAPSGAPSSAVESPVVIYRPAVELPAARANVPPAVSPPARAGAPVPSTVSTAPAEAATATPALAVAPTAPSPREGALLLEARRALDADPAKALALVGAHEKEFPRSQLEPERARIAAEARRRLEK